MWLGQKMTLNQDWRNRATSAYKSSLGMVLGWFTTPRKCKDLQVNEKDKRIAKAFSIPEKPYTSDQIAMWELLQVMSGGKWTLDNLVSLIMKEVETIEASTL